MRPTFRMLSGGSAPLDKKHGQYLGPWGNIGSEPQKGITTYAVSANRQRPLAGTLHAAIFNTWRRFKSQALYVLPPFIFYYAAYQWAVEKNRWYNSKEGRAWQAEQELKKTDGGPVRG